MSKRKSSVAEKEVPPPSMELFPDESGRDIRHSFLGTLDHFPCDFIRTLWVIQSLNVDLKQNARCVSSSSRRVFVEQNLLSKSRYLSRLVDSQLTRLREQRAGLLFERDVRGRYRMNSQGVTEETKENKSVNIKEKGEGEGKGAKRRLVVKIKGSKGLKLRINLRALQEQKQSKMDQKEIEYGEPEQVPKDGIAGEEEEEELFCTCRNASYGKMIACDNERCPIEWFHYGCVGITEAPTGKWYCSLRCRRQAMGRTRIQ